MLSFKRTLRNSAILLLTSVLLMGTVQAASTPIITSITRPMNWNSTYDTYYIQGQSIPVEASISNVPTDINYFWNNYWKGTMSLYSGTTYRGSWTPSSSDFIPGGYSFGQPMYLAPAQFEVRATNSASGVGILNKLGYVTAGNKVGYQSVDSGFWYTNEFINPFYGLATGTTSQVHNTAYTYNCLAYVVDIYTKWQWPIDWPAPNSITLAKMLLYMNGTESGANDGKARTQGTFYNNGRTSWVANTTKVIYYSGGHFAKVVSYNADGSPKEIMSKWGASELIESSTYNAFSSTYGQAKYFFH